MPVGQERISPSNRPARHGVAHPQQLYSSPPLDVGYRCDRIAPPVNRRDGQTLMRSLIRTNSRLTSHAP